MAQNNLESAFEQIRAYIKSLEMKIAEKEKMISDMENKASSLASEKNNAADKLRKMEEEMAELSSVYEELKGRKDVEIDLQEVMKLYILLTEQVLDGSAHIKLLTLLHGQKEEMTKQELSKASGILPAATLRAIFDLRNNGLVIYNEQSETVKLVRKLFT
ncbi:MAG: hypothetical protein ACFFDW_08515 [Candidatus Thorarchaeota archaeon]